MTSRAMTSRASALSPPWYRIRINLSKKLSPTKNSRPTSREKNKKNWQPKKRPRRKRKQPRRRPSRQRQRPRRQPSIRKKNRKRTSCQVLRPNCRLPWTKQPTRLPQLQKQLPPQSYKRRSQWCPRDLYHSYRKMLTKRQSIA